MKVLLVSNQYSNNGVGNPIIHRMRDSLASDNRISKVHFFAFKNRFSTFKKLRKEAKKYDLVHIHFGGLYALLVWISLAFRKQKKIITFHGTDIHAKAILTSNSFLEKLKIKVNQKASFLLIRGCDKVGFVAEALLDYIPEKLKENNKKKFFIQRLGVNYSKFKPQNKTDAQLKLGLRPSRYVLFSDVSNTNIKRRDIAIEIVKNLGPEYKLLVMSGVKSDDVPDYINAADFAILTSDEEGSPNIIREVLALNKPFFSVNVGDASVQLHGLQNSRIISRNPHEAALQILDSIKKPYIDYSRESMRESLDFNELNKSIISLYEDCQHNRRIG